MDVLTHSYSNLLLNNTLTDTRPIVCSLTLNVRQKYIYDATVRACNLLQEESSTDGGTEIGRLLILLGQGGSGKSYTINTIITTLQNTFNYTDFNYTIFVTVGNTDTAVQGSTVHSHTEAFSLLTGKIFQKLQGKALDLKQKKWKEHLRLIVIYKFTMLQQK